MVAGANVKFTDTIKLLGVTLDATLSMDKHVTDVVRACNFHTRALRHIRPLLTIDSANAIGAAIIGGRLDYCNGVMYGTSSRNLDRLQRVQNSLTRVVCHADRSTSVTGLRQSLHWLPVRERIRYKIAAVTYKTRQAGVPVYLANLVHEYQPNRFLRSSGAALLEVPRSSLKFGSLAFSNAAPTVWNSLLPLTRSSSSLSQFKTLLKSELFVAAYPS